MIYTYIITYAFIRVHIERKRERDAHIKYIHTHMYSTYITNGHGRWHLMAPVPKLLRPCSP